MNRKKVSQQFLAVATKKCPRFNKICMAIKHHFAYLRHLRSIDAPASCSGILLAAGRPIYQMFLDISKLVLQQTILYYSVSRSIPDRIVSLSQAHVRPIVCAKARSNVEFGAKISISVTGNGLHFLDR